MGDAESYLDNLVEPETYCDNLGECIDCENCEFYDGEYRCLYVPPKMEPSFSKSKPPRKGGL
jgi:hypothetical protein